MGMAIMSAVKKENSVEYGSSGPWLRLSKSDVVLYTNEHVVRLGKSEGVSEVVTYPKKQYLGEVILSSAPEPDTMMESTNPNVQSGKHSFLADWAVIRLRNALNDPMKVCYAEKKLCHHINGIINVPATGTAAVIGASSREYRMEPWTGTYRCPIINDGLPTTLSPGSWGDNRKELLCWSLSCPRDMDKDKWFDHGIGIKGDSGAGVVDCKTGFLCGLVVGDTKGKLTPPCQRLIVLRGRLCF